MRRPGAAGDERARRRPRAGSKREVRRRGRGRRASRIRSYSCRADSGLSRSVCICQVVSDHRRVQGASAAPRAALGRRRRCARRRPSAGRAERRGRRGRGGPGSRARGPRSAARAWSTTPELLGEQRGEDARRRRASRAGERREVDAQARRARRRPSRRASRTARRRSGRGRRGRARPRAARRARRRGALSRSGSSTSGASFPIWPKTWARIEPPRRARPAARSTKHELGLAAVGPQLRRQRAAHVVAGRERRDDERQRATTTSRGCPPLLPGRAHRHRVLADRDARRPAAGTARGPRRARCRRAPRPRPGEPAAAIQLAESFTRESAVDRRRRQVGERLADRHPRPRPGASITASGVRSPIAKASPA